MRHVHLGLPDAHHAPALGCARQHEFSQLERVYGHSQHHVKHETAEEDVPCLGRVQHTEQKNLDPYLLKLQFRYLQSLLK